MFSSAKLYLGLGVGLIIVLLIGAAVGYFYYSQNRIEALTTEITAVKEQAAALSVTNQALTDSMVANKALLAEHDRQIVAIQQDSAVLKNTLAKHNLQTLAAGKPKLIEKTINKSSDKFFSDLENLTK